jgi:hypothetical protein
LQLEKISVATTLVTKKNSVVITLATGKKTPLCGDPAYHCML